MKILKRVFWLNGFMSSTWSNEYEKPAFSDDRQFQKLSGCLGNTTRIDRKPQPERIDGPACKKGGVRRAHQKHETSGNGGIISTRYLSMSPPRGVRTDSRLQKGGTAAVLCGMAMPFRMALYKDARGSASRISGSERSWSSMKLPLGVKRTGIGTSGWCLLGACFFDKRT